MIASALHYSVPREPGRLRALAMAVFVHAVLFAFLWVGIKWANDKPETLEAEVWSQQELDKAPPPVKPPPEETRETAPAVKQAAPVDNPDIALEQDKKKRREKEKEKEKADEKRAEEKQQEADKQKKLADDKRKQETIDAKTRLRQREADRQRMIEELDSASNSGVANHSQGSQANATWIGRVKAKIKSNTNLFLFLGSGDENSQVEFSLTVLPTGEIINIRKTKPSGAPEFDNAVQSGIKLSDPLPANPAIAGTNTFTISYRLGELKHAN